MNFLSYANLFISWMFIWLLISLYPLQVCGISLKRFKGIGAFCPCSFVDPSVKGINNFLKVCGLIDGFNESRRQIYSEVEKNSDDSMSAIQFCTSPKGDLPHYSYIFRKAEPLRTEMNNMA